MTVVLIFGATLLLASMLSSIASRTPLSTAVLFLAAGLLFGAAGLRLVRLSPEDPVIRQLIELALFTSLFVDGVQIDVPSLARHWALPARALLIGMPLSFGALAAVARLAVGLPWLDAAIVAAILTPTDPVLAAAIVGEEVVPLPLRRLLNVESGLNDGLVLPVIVVLLAFASSQPAHVAPATIQLLGGVVLGVAVPVGAVALSRIPGLAITPAYRPLAAASVALLMLAISLLTGANEFLAAFIGGATVGTLVQVAHGVVAGVGEPLAESLKLAGILVFAMLVSPQQIVGLGPGALVFAILALAAVRPVTIAIALLGADLSWRDRLVAGWFGPKGFSSMLYALFVLGAGVRDERAAFHLAALVVIASILVHTSTDLVVSRLYERQERRGEAA